MGNNRNKKYDQAQCTEARSKRTGTMSVSEKSCKIRLGVIEKLTKHIDIICLKLLFLYYL